MYDRNNIMTKNRQGTNKMTSNTMRKLSLLTLFLLAGCGHLNMFDTNNNQTEYVPYNGRDAFVPPQTSGYTQSQMLADNNPTNYRQVAADYREFGERVPSDQTVVTSGFGSNLSAAIPPTIEEEVSEYEEEINAAISDAENIDEETEAQQSATDDPVEDWLAQEGSTLKGLLTDWSERAGWRLIWNTNRNYTLSAGAMFRGRFADVSSALIRTFARARPAPIATFYKGNRVLVVETMEDENAFN